MHQTIANTLISVKERFCFAALNIVHCVSDPVFCFAIALTENAVNAVHASVGVEKERFVEIRKMQNWSLNEPLLQFLEGFFAPIIHPLEGCCSFFLQQIFQWTRNRAKFINKAPIKSDKTQK